jgi:hypothetical protein
MARTDQPHKIKFDDFVKRATDWGNPLNEKHKGLDYTKPETYEAFNGSRSYVPIWCTVHTKFFTQKVNNHLALGQGCPECSALVKADKRRKKDPISDFIRVHGSTYDYSKVEYKDTHSVVKIVCKLHGEFLQEPNSHLRGIGCPKCGEIKKAYIGTQISLQYKKEYVERARRVHSDEYDYPEIPEHSHADIRIICKTHGEFTQKAYSHLAGVGCWYCGQRTNYTEIELANFVQRLGVTVLREDREQLSGKHIDIWVPERKVGIEYNGSYWHTEEKRGNSHRAKWEIAQSKGIHLVQIFDFEWAKRRPAVENRLKAILGVGNPLFARKTETHKVSTSVAATFYEKYHTQGGKGMNGVSYALHHEGRMVACITVAPSRYDTLQWELLRYASVGRVIGGFAKLFKSFVTDYAPKNIVSYCDLRWGTGELYRKNKFNLERITEPDYWWTNGDNKVSRYSMQNRPVGITEKQHAESLGLSKVLGVGHQKWVWTST